MQREAIIGIAIGILGGGIGAGLQLTGTIAPELGWGVIGICVIIGVFLVGYGFGKGKEESEGSSVSQSSTNVPITLQDGSIESITRGDMSFILSQFALPMSWNHGHMDIEGLIADRASGIPLNELMGRPCSLCGVTRNQKGRDIYAKKE